MTNPAQSARHDSQEARAAPGALYGRARDLYLLSGDDGLLLELGPLLGERYRTRPIDSAEQLTPASAAPWALMIDATARPDARAQAARFKQQYPQAPLLVICADGASADWASPLARGTVSAIVERGALGSAAFAAALTTLDLQMDAISAASAASAADFLTADQPPRRWRRRLLLGLAVLLAAAAGAYFLGGRTTGPARPASLPLTASAPVAAESTRAPALPKAPAAPRTVLELLSDARVAFRDEKSQLPFTDGTAVGASALELYGAVLAQDPQNDEARDGVHRLVSVASARIRAYSSAGKTEDAGRLLAAFRGVGVADDAIATLESEISAARPRGLIAQTRAALAAGDTASAAQFMTQLAAAGGDRAVLAELRRELDSRQTDVRLGESASHAHALIKAGALLEPASDNAMGAVAAMQKLSPDHQLTVAASHELQSALIERAQTATHAAQFDLAQQLLVAAANLGKGPELTAARVQLQNELDAARVRAAAVSVAAPAPPPVAAAPATPEFIRARPLDPLVGVYPQRAYDHGQQGYVIVEFTLDVRGRASELKVVESQPPTVFDDAALQAVKRGRYDTSELGPSGQSQRARLRITFKPILPHTNAK